MGGRTKFGFALIVLDLTILQGVALGLGSCTHATGFGYAGPASSFYPQGSQGEAYLPYTTRALPRRPLRTFPTFPDTPSGLADDIAANVARMIEEDARHRQLEAEAAASVSTSLSRPPASPSPITPGPSLITSAPRLRVDLQLDDIHDLSEEWSCAVSHRYLPLYEKVLLNLRNHGYHRVVAVFGRREEASFVEKRLRQGGALDELQIEYLSRPRQESEEYAEFEGKKRRAPSFPLGGSAKSFPKTKRIDIGSKPEMVVFFVPQNAAGSLAEVSEFQRLTAIATLRGAPVVLVNPALTAYSHLPQGGMGEHVRPMIMSDFVPCFQAAAYRYKYNPYLSYSIVRRGGEAGWERGPWGIFAHDARLPGSGWAYLESRFEEPYRLEVESRYFDSCFYIQKTAGPRGGRSRVGENPFQEVNAVPSSRHDY